MVEKRKGVKFALAEPDDEDRRIVSMIEFQGEVFLSTQKGVYKMVDDKFVRLEIIDNTPSVPTGVPERPSKGERDNYWRDFPKDEV